MNCSTLAASNETNSDMVGFVWGGNNRSTLTLIWTCLVTILACNWTVLHLNIPAPNSSFWAIFYLKLRYMMFTLLFPEMMLALSFYQLLMSYSATEKMRSRGYKDWTIRHSFYGNMGGYVLHYRDETPIPLVMPEIISLLDANPTDGASRFQLPKLSNEYIKSLSKVDEIGKTFAFVQSMWLIASCITRVVDGLPISLLEVITAAYVLCAGGMWACWWIKPLDVRITTRVEYEGEELNETQWMDDEFDERKMNQKVSMLHTPRDSLFLSRMASILVCLLFGLGFGGIHLAAWNFEFPTRTEHIIWRVCSVVTTSELFLVMATMWYVVSEPVETILLKYSKTRGRVLRLYQDIESIWGFLFITAYLASRFVLVFLSLYGLRSMPRGVYTSAAWINYIPHIG